MCLWVHLRTAESQERIVYMSTAEVLAMNLSMYNQPCAVCASVQMRGCIAIAHSCVRAGIHLLENYTYDDYCRTFVCALLPCIPKSPVRCSWCVLRV